MGRSPPGAIAALRYVGRLESQFEAKDSATRTAPAKPTRGAFGGTGAKTPTRSTQDILNDWRN